MPKARTSDIQRRARAVCTRCHSRKVRCDLESCPSGVCSRCQSEGCECQPHIGPRKRKARRTSRATPLPEVTQLELQASRTAPVAPSPNALNRHTINCSPPNHNNDSPQHEPHLVSGDNIILQASQATLLPPPVIIQALSDFYLRELYPLVPVIDREQKEVQESLLLQQCLCFAGSTMRQSSSATEWSSSAIYGRIKVLLVLHHESSPLNMLACLCILGTWLPYAPEAIVLDCPWQWTGMAIRLALQLQLHEEETYCLLEHPGRVRRMWWYLFNSDTLQMACSGRPGMFPLLETRARFPIPSDFDTQDTGAWAFCEFTSLCRLLRKVLELGKVDKSSPDEVFSTLDELVLWRQRLPPSLQLFDESSMIRQTYNRLAVELHIFYLVTIILISFLGRRDNPSLFKYSSMAASACVARLYEEIFLREDVTYLLPIHSWAHLVAAIPRGFSDSDLLNPDRAYEIKISQQVLEMLSKKHTSAVAVRRHINALGGPSAGSFPQADNMWDSLPVPIQDEKKQRVLSLFHFPVNFCQMLDLLRSTGSLGGALLPHSLPMDNDADDWSVDWYSFLFDGAMSF
ncbi:hypothetical protein PENSTE_c010G05638 [Penicillium steckii]|uniref:Zn(2)-C6 fungal-type domain-containing protein n=1 Tax=Penicillium steckii TaxID=303698 RepID=A0A1V6T7S8_9EURO|nr:hypothetical protein PENSTE_c010G05638 [Penicillium steckii]